jgi:hypothetical protein
MRLMIISLAGLLMEDTLPSTHPIKATTMATGSSVSLNSKPERFSFFLILQEAMSSPIGIESKEPETDVREVKIHLSNHP